MAEKNWTKFSMRILIRANIEDIYNAWTSQNNLENWFLRKATFTSHDGGLRVSHSHIQKGDTYLWMWHGYNDEVFEKGAILEANGSDKIQFSFEKAGIVTVNLTSHGAYTMVDLIQDNIPEDEKSKFNYYIGCSNGWTFHLTNFKNIMEGGNDLRNKDVNIKGVLNS